MKELNGMILKYGTNDTLCNYSGDDEELVIPTTVKRIVLRNPNPDDFDMFGDPQCTIRRIYIPESVEYIEDCFFSKFVKLEKITVSEKSLSFRSIDGVLYTKDGKELICYPRRKKEKTIIIPEHVEKLHNEAFYGCEAVRELMIPSTVTYVGRKAFYKCKNLEKVDYKCSYPIVPQKVFFGCQSLTSIEFSEHVRIIQEMAFHFNISLKEIHFPENLSSFGSSAFSACRSLRKIIMNNNLCSFNPFAFYKCINLEEIETQENSRFKFKDGALFTCNLKKLVMFVDQRIERYEIPEGVRIIGEGAFINAEKIISIIIPNTVTVIESDSFYLCKRLESLTIPRTVRITPDVQMWNGRYFKEGHLEVTLD